MKYIDFEKKKVKWRDIARLANKMLRSLLRLKLYDTNLFTVKSVLFDGHVRGLNPGRLSSAVLFRFTGMDLSIEKPWWLGNSSTRRTQD